MLSASKSSEVRQEGKSTRSGSECRWMAGSKEDGKSKCRCKGGKDAIEETRDATPLPWYQIRVNVRNLLPRGDTSSICRCHSRPTRSTGSSKLHVRNGNAPRKMRKARSRHCTLSRGKVLVRPRYHHSYVTVTRYDQGTITVMSQSPQSNRKERYATEASLPAFA